MCRFEISSRWKLLDLDKNLPDNNGCSFSIGSFPKGLLPSLTRLRNVFFFRNEALALTRVIVLHFFSSFLNETIKDVDGIVNEVILNRVLEIWN